MQKRPPRQPLSQQQVTDLLTGHDIQPTQQRLEIAQVLFARDQHLSADDVLKQVNQDTARASKATVYNTLGLFAAKGLIREVIVDPSRVFYDPNTCEHHHFYNVDTGELMDIDADRLALMNLPAPPTGTVADGVDVIIRIRNQATA
ncbi:MAG: transcriptional repressor [Gammaproteobacteria bacterium]|nr:transcriptional repressor [Gammaproteobacteria bacterium]